MCLIKFNCLIKLLALLLSAYQIKKQTLTPEEFMDNGTIRVGEKIVVLVLAYLVNAIP